MQATLPERSTARPEDGRRSRPRGTGRTWFVRRAGANSASSGSCITKETDKQMLNDLFVAGCAGQVSNLARFAGLAKAKE